MLAIPFWDTAERKVNIVYYLSVVVYQGLLTKVNLHEVPRALLLVEYV
jgi:hypothetical protein